MNAIKLLKDDHNKVRRLFQKVKASDSESEKKDLFKQIKEELDVHTHIEEKIFYPAVREKQGLEDIVKEGIQEHHQADVFIKEIVGLSDDSEVFEPKLKVLMEGVEHHAQEEEAEMFPKVEDKFSESDLEELGNKLEKEKQNFKKSQSANA
ncbi:MAG: hemerythrin domain-containing protein [Acidobacteriota bacterium]|jgi:hemerythrin superfamily protein|nr:hemerythrin domain-containing protein [Acidobacteriota bacterium]